MSRGLLWLVGCVVFVLAGCGYARPSSSMAILSAEQQALPGARLPVITTETPLSLAAPCLNHFVPRTLDYTTDTHGDTVDLYDSNGTGVAINDLNNDGKLDIVFANLNGPDTILWNEGNLSFRKEMLDDRDSRAVNIVDVNGDGWLDIVFTHRGGGVSYWRNTGKASGALGVHFVRATLPHVDKPAYAMNWGDLHGGGTLDLVTGSYDAELAKLQRDTFMFGSGGGVFYYEHRGDTFVPQQLAKTSQALAIGLMDVNRDGSPDITVGNDFSVPDQTWVRTGGAWTAAQPFAVTTHSTMGFDIGDIDNNGVPEIFATDMKPYAIDPHTLASWLPTMAAMPTTHDPHDRQIMENVLQRWGTDGQWHNQAAARGVDATGWSWAGKFGDLDNDGFLDLYVVNGMIAHELFHHLPGDELVEENQVRRNDRTGHFVMAPQWGLGSTASGRGMAMADLNNDGSLDIVVNNLRSPAQLFENRLCGGDSLEVDLRWPERMNTRALGAQIVLHTSTGRYTRDVRAASGYLSGDPARVHFGFPKGAVLQRLEVRWPDHTTSLVGTLHPHTLLTITR